MGAPSAARYRLIAIAFLCVGTAFAVLGVTMSESRVVLLLAATTNFAASVVFFLQARRRSGDDPDSP